MSKKTTGTDIGYRAYFAAFAVMLIIIVAAICILSGCLDSIIFRAEVPAADTDTSGIETPAETTGISADTNPVDPAPVDTDEPLAPDTEPQPLESEPVDSESESESDKETETNKPEGDTTKSEDTTKAEDTTKTPDTTDAPETDSATDTEQSVTTPEETTAPTPDTDILTSEIITEANHYLMYEYTTAGLIIESYEGDSAKIIVPMELDGAEVSAIGTGAFAETDNLIEVRLSAGIKKIESGAMSNCPNLSLVYIPTTVKSIAADAFDGSSKVVIHCAKGSYAEKFAQDNGFDFVAK